MPIYERKKWMRRQTGKGKKRRKTNKVHISRKGTEGAIKTIHNQTTQKILGLLPLIKTKEERRSINIPRNKM